MKTRSLLVALVGVGLIAATITPPGGTRFLTHSTPPNPQPIRLLARSHLSLVADLFWIRAIGVTVNLKVPADGLALVSWCMFVTETGSILRIAANLVPRRAAAALRDEGIELDEIVRLSEDPNVRGQIAEVEDHEKGERVVVSLE